MTKVINVLLLLFGVIIIKSHAQTLKPFQSRINKKYGFYNVKTSDTIIPPIYDYTLNFRYGIAPVQVNGYWGYINLKGKQISPFKYELTYDFYNGLAKVYVRSQYGFIDTNAVEVIPLEYSMADFFEDGYCVAARNYKYGLIDKENHVIIDFQYGQLDRYGSDTLYRAVLNNKMALITRSGKALTPFMYDLFIQNRNEYIVVFSNGLRYVIDKCGSLQDFVILEKQSDGFNLIISHDKYGYIDYKDNIAVPAKYDYLGDFKKGCAPACLGCKRDSIGNMIGGKWGFVDQKGKEIVSLIYDCVEPFFHDRASVCMNGRLYYLMLENGIPFIQKEIPIVAEE